MKHIIQSILLLIMTTVSAQQEIAVFKDRNYQCENKWVTYPLEKKGQSYLLGYIYIDRTAGFIYHVEKTFNIGADGKYLPEPKLAQPVKVKIQNLDAVCAVIPKEKFGALGIQETPEFMKSIVNPDEAQDLVLRAGHYNVIGASFISLPLLEKAQKINPNTKNLAFETAYAYNVIKEYPKAIALLQSSIAAGDQNPLVYKELIFSYVSDGQMRLAEETFASMKKIKNATFLDEASYNIAYTYFNQGERLKFQEWAKKALSYAKDKESIIVKNLEEMRKELK